jgi:hypothetical protein
LETSRIGPQRLVLAKGIEGAELSGGAVTVSEGGQCHITVLPDELKNLLHASYYKLTLWADGTDGITIEATYHTKIDSMYLIKNQPIRIIRVTRRVE